MQTLPLPHCCSSPPNKNQVSTLNHSDLTYPGVYVPLCWSLRACVRTCVLAYTHKDKCVCVHTVCVFAAGVSLIQSPASRRALHVNVSGVT